MTFVASDYKALQSRKLQLQSDCVGFNDVVEKVQIVASFTQNENDPPWKENSCGGQDHCDGP